MVLLQGLFYEVVRNNFTIQQVHAPGKHNSLADALLKVCSHDFCHCPPQANPLPTATPTVLANL